MMHRRERGFSLLELIVVVAIGLVVAAIAIPNAMTAIANYRLRSAASNLASMYQSARMQAIHDNKYYAIRWATVKNAKIVYVDLNNNNSFDTGEPNVQLPSGTSTVLGGGPAMTSLNLGWTTKPLPARFNSRGFPCVMSGSVCVTISGTYQVGFWQYVTDTRGAWTAVVATPGGHIRAYFWDGSKWGD